MWRNLHFFLSALVILTTNATSPCAEPDAVKLAMDINRHIDNQLKSQHIAKASQADDAEFVRRIHLDLHGMIPTYGETTRFLADKNPERRSKLISELIADKRYGEYLGDIWQGYLISLLADDRRKRADMLRKWLAEQFNQNSWNQIVTELVTATGKIEHNPAVIYLVEGRNLRTVQDLTDLASRYFLGVRLSCAQCHDHPFVAWKQQEFWGMAAFFSQIQTPGKSKVVYQVGVRDNPEITLESLKDGTTDGFMSIQPTFLGGETRVSDSSIPNRVALAKWMTSEKNPYFAKAMVNRTWWRLFGRGLVNPVDDMHPANAPSHPELLDFLAKRFVESGFDHKFITKAMLLSEAYQRTSKPGNDPEKQIAIFGRMPLKVLAGGQLYDSLVTILGEPVRKGGVQSDARSEFIQFFTDDGEPNTTSYRRGIPHLLRQMNSEQFARNISSLSLVTFGQGRSADEVASELFLKVLSRKPSAVELNIFRESVAHSSSLEASTRELAWALLMTSEFSLNH